MKKEVHPKYVNARISCACGNIIETKSTKGDMHIDICSQCHPFFTGKQKFVDSGGRIERFKKKYSKKSKPSNEDGASEHAEEAGASEQSEG